MRVRQVVHLQFCVHKPMEAVICHTQGDPDIPENYSGSDPFANPVSLTITRVHAISFTSDETENTVNQAPRQHTHKMRLTLI